MHGSNVAAVKCNPHANVGSGTWLLLLLLLLPLLLLLLELALLELPELLELLELLLVAVVAASAADSTLPCSNQKEGQFQIPIIATADRTPDTAPQFWTYDHCRCKKSTEYAAEFCSKCC